MIDPQGHEASPATGRGLRARFWVEGALAGLAGVLAAITAVVPDWIERLTGAHPDSGGGELEWMFAFIPAAVALALAVAARREWRRAVAA